MLEAKARAQWNGLSSEYLETGVPVLMPPDGVAPMLPRRNFELAIPVASRAKTSCCAYFFHDLAEYLPGITPLPEESPIDLCGSHRPPSSAINMYARVRTHSCFYPSYPTTPPPKMHMRGAPRGSRGTVQSPPNPKKEVKIPSFLRHSGKRGVLDHLFDSHIKLAGYRIN